MIGVLGGAGLVLFSVGEACEVGGGLGAGWLIALPDESGKGRGRLSAGLGVGSFVGGDVLEGRGGEAGGADGVDAVGGGEGSLGLVGFEEVGELGWGEVEDVAEEVGGEAGIGEEGEEIAAGRQAGCVAAPWPLG